MSNKLFDCVYEYEDVPTMYDSPKHDVNAARVHVIFGDDVLPYARRTICQPCYEHLLRTWYFPDSVEAPQITVLAVESK